MLASDADRGMGDTLTGVIDMASAAQANLAGDHHENTRIIIPLEISKSFHCPLVQHGAIAWAGIAACKANHMGWDTWRRKSNAGVGGRWRSG